MSQQTQNYPFYQPMQYRYPNMQPQVNAVKIEINGDPKAYGGMNDKGEMNPSMPQANGFYNYPYAPLYMTPGAYPMPPMMPVPALPQQTPAAVAPTPVAVPPVPQSINSVAPQFVPNSIAVPAPTPIPIPPIPIAMPPINQHVNVNSPQNAPGTTTTASEQSIPSAVADKNTENTTVKPVAPVENQHEATTTVDVDGLMNSLKSTNPDDQTAAIQKMAEIAQTDPVSAKALLTEQTFGQLANIINADTSKLQGPTGPSDPQNLSSLEKAEINKQIAVYTLAILQKNFRDEINKEMAKNGLANIAINDLPFIKEGIVDNLKDNPNPNIREACLSALNYVGRPEDKDVLKTLYEITANHDDNPQVQATAKDFLSKLPA